MPGHSYPTPGIMSRHRPSDTVLPKHQFFLRRCANSYKGDYQEIRKGVGENAQELAEEELAAQPVVEDAEMEVLEDEGSQDSLELRKLLKQVARTASRMEKSNEGGNVGNEGEDGENAKSDTPLHRSRFV
ncbi:hypothetical protein BGZ95_001647 [Linnemannia exigua]|uniref:Uncharacterized protein n=1 Tax=Linnemannia exigua TaxID=604196 RepID=A0AAD4D6K6_9FUNG|nr:hypothetical protein BGZ95_001647 [Linnemannia exigua]